jgi:general secretion pathway protein G
VLGEIYVGDVGAAREAVLKTDLQQMRNAINQYKTDHNHAPNSLRDLSGHAVSQRDSPRSHHAPTNWLVVRDTGNSGPKKGVEGVVDIRSGSSRCALDGTPYNTS